MLPARRAALAGALERFDARRRSDLEREVRVTLLDSSVVEGLLMSHADKGLSLEDRSGRMVFVATEEIGTLEVGGRRGAREFVVVSAMILGITALLVVEWSIPFLRAHVPLPWLAAQLALFGFAGIVQLRRRTALGRWLRSWTPVFDVERPVGRVGPEDYR